MVKLLFGDREVGTMFVGGGTGLGKILYENGFDSVFDLEHHSPQDGEQEFLDSVVREFDGEYFKAVPQEQVP